MVAPGRPRELQWHYTASSVELTFYPRRGPVNLQVTTLQAFVLLALDGDPFVAGDEMSRSRKVDSAAPAMAASTVSVVLPSGPVPADVALLLGLDPWLTASLLHSLACSRFPVLRKEPLGRYVAPTDRFFINDDFMLPQPLVPSDGSGAVTIVLPLPLLEAPPKPVIVKQRQDNSLALDAVLVRLLKRAANALSVEQVTSEALKIFPSATNVYVRCGNLVCNLRTRD